MIRRCAPHAVLRTAAIILARGGSKRIPRKNTRLFRGRPLVAYAIQASQQSGVFDQIVVSTDDPDIERIALDAGAAVPFVRPPELSEDEATTDAAMSHAVEFLVRRFSELEWACCIYPSPFVSPGDLCAGLELLVGSGASSVIPVMRYDFPIEQALRVVEGKVLPVDPEAMEQRSQDLVPSFHDAGLFYWTRVNEFRRTHALLEGDLRALELPTLRCQDINTLDDWALAELKFDLIHRENQP